MVGNDIGKMTWQKGVDKLKNTQFLRCLMLVNILLSHIVHAILASNLRFVPLLVPLLSIRSSKPRILSTVGILHPSAVVRVMSRYKHVEHHFFLVSAFECKVVKKEFGLFCRTRKYSST